MDQEPPSGNPQSAQRPETWQAPPPPPPPRPNQGYYYFPYGQPPVPPRSHSSFWRFLAFLLFLCILAFCALLVFGMMFGGGLGRGGIGPIGPGDKLGLVRIEGIIMQGEEQQSWIDALRHLAEHKSIKGLIVRIDSPGGTVGASQELYETLNKIRLEHKKPIYVSMGDVAASGGYYTATAADTIYAMKGTLTGSIGVIISLPQISELTKKLGVENETIKSGRFKDAGNFWRPMSPEERELFGSLIQDTYNQFIGDVMARRQGALATALKAFPEDQWTPFKFTKPAGEVTPEAFLRQIADGRVYTGQQALKLGLIDQIGSLADVKEALGKKVGLGPKPEVYEVVKRKTFFDMLRGEVGNLLPSSRSPLQFMMNLP